MPLSIFATEDGSHSLVHQTLNETYHSRHGAIQESQHVFIKNGIAFWLERNISKPVKILEVGFGTGLNALLTLEQTILLSDQVEYTTLEPYPLSEKLTSQLNYPQIISFESSRVLFSELHAAPWNQSIAITPNFTLNKQEGRIQEISLVFENYDLVFFDAFAPTKQPDMWQSSIFEKIHAAMKPRGILVTYCAKGQVKRDLKSLGFEVESLPGPPGKREMIRAMKL